MLLTTLCFQPVYGPLINHDHPFSYDNCDVSPGFNATGKFPPIALLMCNGPSLVNKDLVFSFEVLALPIRENQGKSCAWRGCCYTLVYLRRVVQSTTSVVCYDNCVCLCKSKPYFLSFSFVLGPLQNDAYPNTMHEHLPIGAMPMHRLNLCRLVQTRTRYKSIRQLPSQLVCYDIYLLFSQV